MRLRRRILGAWWLLCAVLLGVPSAHATISCSVAVNSISVFYNPAGPTVTSSAFYTITCNRDNLADGPIVNYSLVSDNGLQPAGQNRQVAFSGSTYRYSLYKNSGFTPNDQWGTPNPASRAITGSMGFPAGSTTVSSGTLLYYIEILTGQPVGPAGVYTDTVGATLNFTSTPNSGSASTAFNVSVTSITNCTVTAPTSLTFSYTSFQPTAATPSANFTVNCTTGTPYTIVLDNTGPITDNAVNLTYTLGLSAAAGTGTGTNQTYQVLGNMAAGQSGTCATSPCTNAAATNRTRSITVNY